MKKPQNVPGQIQFSFQDDGELEYETTTDESCFFVSDIADFIEDKFAGRAGVPLDEIWAAVDEHPVFPSDLYKNDIKKDIKERGYKVHTSSIDFK